MATFSDSFDRANASTLGANWSQGGGVVGITSNQSVVTDTGFDECAWNTPADSSNNFSEVTIQALGTTGYRSARVRCRGTLAGQSYDFSVVYSGGWERYLIRRVGGNDTTLASDFSNVTLPATIRVEANGSTIRALWNGTEIFNVTDTAISTGTRVGFTAYSNSLIAPAVTVDNWTGGDLGGGTPNRRVPTIVVAGAARAHAASLAGRRLDTTQILRSTLEVNELQAVSATRSTSWHVRQVVAATRSSSWGVSGQVSKALSTTWHVLRSITTTRSTSWGVRALVPATVSTTWHTLAGVAASVATSWHTLATVTSPRATSWHTAALVTSSRSTSWGVRAVVAATTATSWGVRALVSAARSTTWGVRAVVSAARSTSWGVRAVVSATRATTWNVAGEVVNPSFVGTSIVEFFPFVVDATGTSTPPAFSGSSAADLPELTALASGTSTPPAFTGTSALSLPVVSLDATGTRTIPPRSGTSASTMPELLASGLGAVIRPHVTGTATGTLPNTASTASGTVVPPSYTGTGHGILPQLGLESVGTYVPEPRVGTGASQLPELLVVSTSYLISPITGTSEVLLPDYVFDAFGSPVAWRTLDVETVRLKWIAEMED